MKIDDKTRRHQAPLKKFKKHEERYTASMEPKNNKKNADRNRVFSHCSAITSDIRQVVTSIPQIMARPERKLIKNIMKDYDECINLYFAQKPPFLTKRNCCSSHVINYLCYMFTSEMRIELRSLYEGIPVALPRADMSRKPIKIARLRTMSIQFESGI